MVFDINDYAGRDIVMHCANIFEAISFTNYLHSVGKRWSNGARYVNNHAWESYKEETAYNFNENSYGHVTAYQRDGYSVLEWKDFMYDMPSRQIDKVNLYDHNIITISGADFIKFPEENGLIPVVKLERWGSEDFGRTNNLGDSSLICELYENFLPQIEAEIGSENICQFDNDLTSLHGEKTYGTVRTRISVPTFDFYRKHKEIFDKYIDDINGYWWLSTPWTVRHRNGDQSNLCTLITSEGTVSCDRSNYGYAVRPILYIKAEALTVQN